MVTEIHRKAEFEGSSSAIIVENGSVGCPQYVGVALGMSVPVAEAQIHEPDSTAFRLCRAIGEPHVAP